MGSAEIQKQASSQKIIHLVCQSVNQTLSLIKIKDILLIAIVVRVRGKLVYQFKILLFSGAPLLTDYFRRDVIGYWLAKAKSFTSQVAHGAGVYFGFL